MPFGIRSPFTPYGRYALLLSAFGLLLLTFGLFLGHLGFHALGNLGTLFLSSSHTFWPNSFTQLLKVLFIDFHEFSIQWRR
jgi:hypothetical protein